MDANTKKVMWSSAKTGGSDDFETPWKFFNLLNETFHFTLDPCASHSNHKCQKYFTIEDDGLAQSWKNERAFVNNPYSQNKLWMKKCFDEGLQDDTLVAWLGPSRTDALFWHNYCLKANDIIFVKGRIYFELNGKPKVDVKGRPMPAGFPSSVVIFDGNEKKRTNPRIWALDQKTGLIMRA